MPLALGGLISHTDLAGVLCVRVQPWDGGGAAAEAYFSCVVRFLDAINSAFDEEWHVLCLAIEIFVRALVDPAGRKYVLWPKDRVFALCAAAYGLALKQISVNTESVSTIAKGVFGSARLRERCDEVAKVECWLFAHLGHCIPQLAAAAVAIDNKVPSGANHSKRVRRHYLRVLRAVPTPELLSLNAATIAKLVAATA